MLYVGDKQAVLYKGDFHPAALYKGGQMIAGYDEQTYTGTEIAVTDTYNDDLSLTVFGRSEQNGTPAPDAPVPIKSSFEGGGDLRVTGSNLWGGRQLADDIMRIVPYAIIDEKESTVTYNAAYVYGKTVLIGCFEKNTQYTFELYGYNTTIEQKSENVTNLIIVYNDGSMEYVAFNRKQVSKAGATVTQVRGVWVTGSAVLYYNTSGVYKTSDKYRPFVGQTISPPVLRSIPVTPDYPNPTCVDASGQAWVADEWRSDGAVVRRIGVKVFDGTEPWRTQSITVETLLGLWVPMVSWGWLISDLLLKTSSFCSVASIGASGQAGSEPNIFSPNREFSNFLINVEKSMFPSLDGWLAFLTDQHAAGTPVTVQYILATPTTETLPSTPLRTNPHTTNIYTTTAVKPWLSAQIKTIQR